MSVRTRVSVWGAVLLGCAGGLQGAALAPGTLYALVFDNGSGMETVVTVDPASGAFTPVGAGVADCCTIGGFPVLALDAESGGFYAAGNLFSDPPGSPKRLLGFDAVSGAPGALLSSPFLPAGFNYNLVKLDVVGGTLYGLVFDFGIALETVVTVDPATGALTPIAGGIADCCTLGGFNVSALDPASGRLYAAGNLLSDPPGPQRLLGFDLAAGTLASSPFLPGGFNYNDFELDPLTGTLYGLVFDFGTSQEVVVTVDPATAALTPVASGIADCCTVSSFSTLDPHNGVLYIMGNRLSDPPGSGPRLLGFDVASGTLASQPFLPAGFSFNILQAAVVPPANQPPVAVCRDLTVDADPGLCTAAMASIDDGSHDPDGDPITTSQDPAGPYPVGDTLVTLTVEDGQGGSDSCQGTVTVVDGQAPVLSCNSPATITPPDAPIGFTASAVDNCGPAAVEVLGHDCWMFTRKGKRIDKTESCEVEIDGAQVTILDSGGVGDHIGWEVRAEDAGGNAITMACELVVVSPGH